MPSVASLQQLVLELPSLVQEWWGVACGLSQVWRDRLTRSCGISWHQTPKLMPLSQSVHNSFLIWTLSRMHTRLVDAFHPEFHDWWQHPGPWRMRHTPAISAGWRHNGSGLWQLLTAVWFTGKPHDICPSKAMVSCPSAGHGVGSVLTRDWAEISHNTAASLGMT